MRILLIEDETRMSDAVSEILRQENYDVDVCNEGISGCDALLSNIYDLAILDVMLPGMSGLDIIRKARIDGITIPCLMLTAKTEVSDKVNGLDAGADDYLTKPFQVDELLARIRALTRRGATVKKPGNTLSCGDLTLNTSNCLLTCSLTGRDIRLPDKEFHIMEYLMENQDRIISKEQLALKVWGFENEAEYNNVEVYISFTRKKIHFLGSKTEIKAVRGMGYELKG